MIHVILHFDAQSDIDACLLVNAICFNQSVDKRLTLHIDLRQRRRLLSSNSISNEIEHLLESRTRESLLKVDFQSCVILVKMKMIVRLLVDSQHVFNMCLFL